MSLPLYGIVNPQTGRPVDKYTGTITNPADFTRFLSRASASRQASRETKILLDMPRGFSYTEFVTSDQLKYTRLETEALVIGYAMSRLDTSYCTIRKFQTWTEAYAEAGQVLARSPADFKNLRDEFDPVHANPRQGWHKRPLRQNRQRVIDELQEVSDEALMEMVVRILQQDDEAVVEAIDALAVVTRVPYNVAERLLTGRRAEEYFLEHCARLVQVQSSDVVDLRQSAQGFDFGVRNQPERAIEVKGLKQMRGGIQFTDREWTEAKRRHDNYLLVVVGNLAAEPIARVFPNPHSILTASCTIQTTITAIWRATVTVRS